MLLSVVSSLLSLICVEVFLQAYYRYTNVSWLWSYNAFRTTYIEPVNDRRQYSLRPGFEDSGIGIKINSAGFRGSSDVDGPTPDEPVVVILGDSKAFGSGVRDSETYASRLDRKFRDNGIPIRVLNAGVPSYNARQAIDRFRIDVASKYNVRAVVFQVPFNDISLASHYRDDWGPDVTWAGARFGDFAPPLPWTQKSAIVYYVNRALQESGSPSRPSQGEITYESVPSERLAAHLKNEISGFLQECGSRSIPVVLLPTDPFYYQTARFDENESLPLWAPSSKFVKIWQPLVLSYDALLKDAAGTSEFILWLDIRRNFDETDRSKLYIDFIHYSAEGNQLVADNIYNLLTSDPTRDKLTP